MKKLVAIRPIQMTIDIEKVPTVVRLFLFFCKRVLTGLVVAFDFSFFKKFAQ